MSRVVLVTGGSRSGKSQFGENIYAGRNDILYIATAIVTDDEMKQRIERHRNSRNGKWKTYEGFKNLDKALCEFYGTGIILDCITIMVTNLLFEKGLDIDNFNDIDMENMKSIVEKEIKLLVDSAREKNMDLVMITNEVGYGIVPEYKLSRVYRDLAGFVNQYVASISDEVYLVACGLPLKLK